jgi:hypothetical protein
MSKKYNFYLIPKYYENNIDELLSQYTDTEVNKYLNKENEYVYPNKKGKLFDSEYRVKEITELDKTDDKNIVIIQEVTNE